MANSKVNVFINPMRLFEWDSPRVITAPPLPDDPTPERLLQFLTSTDFGQFQIEPYRERYIEISGVRELVTFFNEPELNENVFGPLRHAKTSYILSNYVGTIALCGLVAEKVTLLIHEIHTDDENEHDRFERRGQEARVKELKAAGWIGQSLVEHFGNIRGARRRYLHYWNAVEPRIRKEAVRCYSWTTEAIIEAMGITFVNGALVVRPEFAKYLTQRGTMTHKDGPNEPPQTVQS
jgi:hypothetical protein